MLQIMLDRNILKRERFLERMFADSCYLKELEI